jgi:hypothetical protein
MWEDLAASLQSISELCIHTTHLNSIHHIILLGSQNPRNRWKVKQVKSGKENIDVKSKVSDINNLCFFKHSLAQNVQIENSLNIKVAVDFIFWSSKSIAP